MVEVEAREFDDEEWNVIYYSVDYGVLKLFIVGNQNDFSQQLIYCTVFSLFIVW